MKCGIRGVSYPAVRRGGTRGSCCAELLEQRQLLSGDLTGAFTGAVPAGFLPRGKNKLAVQVMNTGDADITDPFRVALFASTDATLDDGDTRFFSVDKHVKL